MGHKQTRPFSWDGDLVLPSSSDSAHLKKMKKHIYKFQKILKTISDVANGVSHNHVKYQLQILYIL